MWIISSILLLELPSTYKTNAHAKILELYEKATKQRINKDKSKVFSLNMKDSMNDKINALLGFPKETFQTPTWAIPLIKGSIRKALWESLISIQMHTSFLGRLKVVFKRRHERFVMLARTEFQGFPLNCDFTLTCAAIHPAGLKRRKTSYSDLQTVDYRWQELHNSTGGVGRRFSCQESAPRS